MSRKKQVIQGLKQISQGAMRVLGLTKILSLLSPYFKSLSNNTSSGYMQIKQGVLHALGRTKAQQLDAWLTKLLVEPQDEDMHDFYKGLYRYYHMDPVGYTGNTCSTPFTPKECVALARDVLHQMNISKLVGVQPMRGPVDIAQALTFKFAETEVLNENEGGSALDNLPDVYGRRGSLELSTLTVQAGSRKTSPKITSDALASPEIRAHLVEILAQEIAAEMDVDQLTYLNKLSTKWDNVRADVNMLPLHINKAANEIARGTRRGAGNWAVVSMDAATILSQSKIFTPTPSKNDGTVFNEIGVLNGCITVYLVSPIYESAQMCDVLVGYKGPGQMDTGHVFCPYIPILFNGVMVDPNTFEPVCRTATRFGMCDVANAASYYIGFDLE